MKKKNKIAICYDFDGTLSPKNMQEYSFIPELLQISNKDFWKEVNDNAKDNDMDEILSYLELMIDKAKLNNVKMDKESLKRYGKDIPFFEGVKTWFDRINKYGKNKEVSIDVEHYIISSGLKPMIEGTAIAKNFKHIFACDFKYDQHDVPQWPSAVINYTTKTQYLFRINKHQEDKNSEYNLLNNWNNSVNKYLPDEKRYISFSQMIYIGDGLTDIPAMKMLNYQGGYSIAIYNQDKKSSKNKESPKQICEQMLKEKRCSFIAPADYQQDTKLERLVKMLIDKIICEITLQEYSKN